MNRTRKLGLSKVGKEDTSIVAPLLMMTNKESPICYESLQKYFHHFQHPNDEHLTRKIDVRGKWAWLESLPCETSFYSGSDFQEKCHQDFDFVIAWSL